MARKPKTKNDDAPDMTGHNSGERRAIILDVHGKMLHIEARIEALGKELKEQRGRIKSLGMKAKIFNAVRNFILLEEESERDADMDAFRECYEALLPGEQLDWLKASEPAKPAVSPSSEQSSKDMDEAYFNGSEAGKTGKEAKNPWPAQTPAWDQWNLGYSDGQEENRATLGQGR